MDRGERISREKVRKYHSKGLNDREIADRLGCSKVGVFKVRRELGLDSNHDFKEHMRKVGRKDIDYEELYRDYMNGMSYEDLIDKYGYSCERGLKESIGNYFLSLDNGIGEDI